MKISTKIAATVIALCSAATAAAAPATIRSSIDSTTMTMGNKTIRSLVGSEMCIRDRSVWLW